MTAEPIFDDELLTVEDLAREMPFDRETFYTWRKRGTGPRSFKLGSRRVVYRRSVVEAWFAAQEEATAKGGAS